ncbi:hypothetical protein DERP_002205 [Dermatophagoides pteronyssinus]|uniref:Uncharacterized protein n=1 Tax=Dermatophagoides pteronyssinus TaxID=6956 RepID=A0ABQ8JHR3_DERPT|nr:hypothetical protein DERP_002205 [Dermatophagoides pteronyssinus]
MFLIEEKKAGINFFFFFKCIACIPSLYMNTNFLVGNDNKRLPNRLLLIQDFDTITRFFVIIC